MRSSPDSSSRKAPHTSDQLAPKQTTISKKLAQRIARQSRQDPGRVFTPFDFLDLGSPHSVGMTLLRLVRLASLRHLARGLYDVPRRHALLGDLQPTAEAIAQALARRDGATIQPMEAMAANLLGLSEQVPAKAIFLTDGPARLVTVGPVTVQLKQRPLRQVGSAASTSSLVFAALRSLGKANVTKGRVAHLRETLSPKDQRRLLKDLPLAPVWMHQYLRYIAGGEA